MENKRKILYRAFSIGVLAILLALGGWFISSRLDPHYNAWSGFSSQDKSSDTVTVRLKLLHGPQFAGMYVAQEKGWYKDVGLKVDLLERDFRSPSTGDEVRDGQVDFGILNPLEILARHASQEPIKAVAAIFQHSPSTLVSLAKNPVTKPEQIRNKTIGVTTQQPESLTLANTLLRKYKVPMNTVVFTTTGPEQIPTLLSGGADAVFMYSTSLPKLDTKNVQYKTLSPSQYGIDTYDDVIVTSHNLVDTNPTLVQNFITATLKGWEYASQNPEEALDLTLRYMPGQTQQEIAIEAQILQRILAMIKTEDGAIGTMEDSRWESMHKTLKENFVLSDFDYHTAFTTQFLTKKPLPN